MHAEAQVQIEHQRAVLDEQVVVAVLAIDDAADVGDVRNAVQDGGFDAELLDSKSPRAIEARRVMGSSDSIVARPACRVRDRLVRLRSACCVTRGSAPCRPA